MVEAWDRDQRAHAAMLKAAAWHTAYLGRIKPNHFPRFNKFMEEKKPAFTPGEAKALKEAWPEKKAYWEDKINALAREGKI